MKTLGYLALIPMMIFGIRAYAQPGYYPPPANVIYHNDTLTICPPDSIPGEPVVLLAYNILVDSVFFDNLPVTDPTDTLDYIFTFPDLPPGMHSFCVNAVYNQWISDQACDSDTLIYGYELPFLEDWSSGSFETLQWTSSSDNWVISNEEGNPAPAVEFRGDPVQTDYSFFLESYPMNASSLIEGKIWLDFDLKLDCINSTGAEQLWVEVWNWTNKVWTAVAKYDNYDGSFTWSDEHVNIKAQAMKKVFKIRFHATGANSGDIQNWFIDNIHIYRACDAASDLVLEENNEFNDLWWWAMWGPCPPDEWIHWDDGVNSGSSIGTGGPVEFDAAARWEPAQLADFQGLSMTKVSFFPAEVTADYSIRVWTGANPDTLVINQPVTNPEIGAWNVVSLTTPLLLDISKELWVGYHVSTPTGYPAGIDDGPAINGYGNMMYYDGEWQTLLEINPDLDYNWNIQWFLSVGPDPDPDDGVHFNIYRQKNNEEFQFYDISHVTEYLDTAISLSDHYCYRVNMVWTDNGDTCESEPTNIACEIVNLGITHPQKDKNIKIYPNPAKKWLNIKSEQEIREIRIYNMIGEEILKLEIGNLEAQVDVSQLHSGIYYVKVTTIGSEFKEKIVILR